MKSTAESVPSEIDARISSLLDGPPSNNYNLRQIQLVVEKFCIEHPEEKLTKEKLEEIMMAWSDPGNYSKIWGNFVNHPEFKNHPRFLGNYANVTLKDLEEFTKTEKLPM